MPNFIITGTKLMFISPEKEESIAKGGKTEAGRGKEVK